MAGRLGSGSGSGSERGRVRGRWRGRGRGRAPPREEDQLMDEGQLTDGAIALFAPMGYPEADIRSTIQQLIEVYGEAGMRLLQEDHYQVVQDLLFEKQEQEERPQLLLEQEDPNMQQRKL